MELWLKKLHEKSLTLTLTFTLHLESLNIYSKGMKCLVEFFSKETNLVRRNSQTLQKDPEMMMTIIMTTVTSLLRAFFLFVFDDII